MRVYGLAAVLIVILSGCGSPAPSCRVLGQACAVTADCCVGNLICTNNTCSTPSTCLNTGQACGGSTPCCSGLTCAGGLCGPKPPCGPGTCAGCCDASGVCQLGLTSATCGSGGGACIKCASAAKCSAHRCVPTAPSCGLTGTACTTAATCCSGLTCRLGDGQCGKGALLDPCTDAGECYSGVCEGWCTQNCINSAGCGTSGVCVTTSGGYDICFPYCPNTSYCTDNWPGTACRLVNDTSGTPFNICSG